MQTKIDVRGSEAVIVSPQGPLDILSADKLYGALQAAQACDVRHVVIDLTSVTFMDGSGIDALHNAWRTLCQTGTTLALAGAHPQIRTMLLMTRMDHFMPIHDSVEAALGRCISAKAG